LVERDTIQIASNNSSFIQTELNLTKQFIKLENNNAAIIYGTVLRKKQEVLQLADFILHKQKRLCSICQQ